MSEKNPPSAFQLDPHMRKIALMIGYMIIVAGFAYAISALWPAIAALVSILAPFIVALVVAYIFNPIVNFVQRRLKLTRVGGVVVVNLIILLIMALFIAIIIPILTTQIKGAYRGIRDTTQEKILPAVSMKLSGMSPKEIETRIDLYDDLEAELEALESSKQNISDKDATAFFKNWALKHDAYPAIATEIIQALDKKFIHGMGNEVPIRFLINEVIGNRAQLKNPTGTWDSLVNGFNVWMREHNINPDDLAQKALGSSSVRTAAREAASGSAGIVGRVFSGVASAIGAVINSTMFLILTILVSIYLLIDFASFRGVVEILCPDKYEARFFDVLEKLDHAVGGFIRGQVISAVLVGLLTFVGLMVLGLKQYALLIGFIAGIGNLIPYLGPVMGATPAVLYMLMSDAHPDTKEKLIFSGLVIALFGLIQVIDGFVFQPKIVGKSAQLHPVVVIMALALGGQFGLMGMIIAVPAACIGRVLLKEFFWDDLETEWRRTTGKENLDDPPKKVPGHKKTSKEKKDAK